MTKARKSRVVWVIPLLVTIFSLSLPAYAKYGGGTGEPNDPYLIDTAEQMNEIGLHQEDWDKHFKLMADIDLGSFTGTSYNIIGGEWDNPFTGVFDGNNKKILNFNYSSMGRYKVGIFGYIYNPNAEVKDLGLIDPIIDAEGGSSVGSLVGNLRDGTIINCYAQGGSVSGYDGVGGLVGLSFESTITNCYATTSVSGNKDIGGLTGNAGIITNCYAAGNVSGYENVGGLVGKNYEMITNCYSMSNVSGQENVGGLVGDNRFRSITNCYSISSVTGNIFVGGLVGVNSVGKINNCYSSAFVKGTYYVGGLVGDGGGGTITNCYSSTSATGTDSVGGLVGTNQWGTITNCYSIGHIDGLFNAGGLVGYMAGNVTASFWDTQTSEQATSAGGMGLTTAEMNDPNTFINAGWDFFVLSDNSSYIWTWVEPEGGGYPILWWQLPKNFGLPAFSGGTGEPNNPYLISTANELNNIGYYPRLMDAHFKLINDIDLTGVNLFSIGTNLYPFAGMFDGNGKKISNLGGTQGLFENVRGEHAHIKDLGLIDPNIDAGIGNGGGVGSLVGTTRYGTIINCYAQGGSVSGGVRIGGLVGDNSSSIANCYSSTSVSGAFGIGGLVGVNINGTITSCYAKGNVSISHVGAGGLVGRNYEGTIENCYSTGDVQEPTTGNVEGPNDVGGLVGHNNAGIIKNCYSVGYVQGLDYVGGLIGKVSEDGTVITSFWDAQTSGQEYLNGGKPSTHGLPLQTDQMQTATIFLIVGWDFVDETYNGIEDIWKISEGLDYPRLWWEKYGGGTGEPNDPYRIYTAEQLNTIGTEPNDLDKHFRLMADIDLGIYTAGEFNVIGEYGLEPFIGVFDGNNHTISNFTYSPTRMPFISGLFGQVGSFEFQANAVIKDLGLIDPNIDAGTGWWVGSLAGLFVGGTITNCYVQGGSVSGDQDVGGLVGGAALMFNSSVRPDELSNSADYQRPEIFNCYTTCDVSGNENVGGLLGGGNLHLKISRCYSTGSISGDKWIGGLVGRNNGNISTCYSTASVLGNEDVGGLVGRKVSGKIYGCYSTGSVSGDRCIGGLVGCNAGIIEDCYSAGYVSGITNVGGLLGSSTRNSVYTSFWDIETSGQIDSVGGIGLTTAEMQSASTFLEAGWDFVDESANGTDDIWKISEDLNYPRLWWERYSGGTGEPNNPYLIYTAEHLNAMGAEPNDWDKHFKLMADIDLSDYSYDRAVIAPDIGGDGYTFPGTSFTGVFDGNGHAVSHLTITGKSYLGLFGQLGSGAEVKDLGVVDVNITGSYYAIGGLVGNSFRGNITTSYSTGTVTGYNYVGGLAGYNKYGDIVTSYSTAAVSATFSGNQKIGGLVGVNAGRITTSYSTGPVSGQRVVGGLAGYATGSFTMCYSTGMVSGDQDVGGFLGDRHPDYSIVTGCFWDVETSGQSSSAGGTGLTTAEMQTADTFLDANWDFVDEIENGADDIWWILEGQNYPRL